ncbi:Rrf2 family transcriptional regulator [Sharpea azabuensis]|jgi:Rrf2 family iron-sulfur cluster assembly transcriptional regulator|uniref:Rrf2 family transcriptional regulator n=1 Tax=Sharpea porci TaxID=2652286 RepID=A0A844FWC0_9FIRM|nr:Rrf2 family transcriptional regulator [Sharpea porci]MDD6710719.1 Rrf2 family transcriptional regulator [Sharpea porci]MDY5279322.1 Rrf2 family transcriptional regulator [Sharpea porci]MST90034.1 Rrf2 family transcriptional regulator [Sharpea porci]
MKVSTKGRYALRVMVDLAEHDPTQFIPLKDIAERQDISEKYLEVIIKSLSKAHFVEGLRGKGGGYRLTREASTYTVASILEVTEGSLVPIACMEDDPNQCERHMTCKTLPMWQGLYKVTKDYLDGITLDELTGSGVQGDNYVI